MADTARWFVFDLGNVLIRLSYERVIGNICAQADADRDQMISLLETAGGYRDLEKGLVTFEEFHSTLCQVAGYRGGASDLREIWSDFFDGPVEGIDRLLDRVRERYQVAFLSNSNEVHELVIAEKFKALFREHEPILYSHRLKTAKPDHEIFRRLLDRLQAKPSEILYTDDLLENVRAAREMGIRAWLFESALGLESQLEGEGLL